MMEDLQFVEIPNFPGYRINRFGQIYSERHRRILIGTVNKKNGYQYITLGRGYRFLVHRLVATVFLPNPHNKRTVNHKNTIKTDNYVDNLEWATYSENHKHAYKNGVHKPPRSRLGKFGKDNPTAKKVIQRNLNGEFVAEWCGAYEASRKTGYSVGNINACCVGIRKTAYGFKWSRS